MDNTANISSISLSAIAQKKDIQKNKQAKKVLSTLEIGGFNMEASLKRDNIALAASLCFYLDRNYAPSALNEIFQKSGIGRPFRGSNKKNNPSARLQYNNTTAEKNKDAWQDAQPIETGKTLAEIEKYIQGNQNAERIFSALKADGFALDMPLTRGDIAPAAKVSLRSHENIKGAAAGLNLIFACGGFGRPFRGGNNTNDNPAGGLQYNITAEKNKDAWQDTPIADFSQGKLYPYLNGKHHFVPYGKMPKRDDADADLPPDYDSVVLVSPGDLTGGYLPVRKFSDGKTKKDVAAWNKEIADGAWPLDLSKIVDTASARGYGQTPAGQVRE